MGAWIIIKRQTLIVTCEVWAHCSNEKYETIDPSLEELELNKVGESTYELCTNGVDDDFDGAMDCKDVECMQLIECVKLIKVSG